MANATFFLFKVTVEPRTDDGFQSLKEILDQPLEEYTPLATASGNAFELDQEVTKRRGLYFGSFCSIQTTEIPPKKKLGEAPVDLLSGDDDDTGLGHYTSFVYDPSNNIIAVQSNRNGVSANGIAYFFRRNYEIRSIKFEPVINPSEFSKLDRLTSISTFEINIAKLESLESFSTQSDNITFKDVAKVADDTNGSTLRIVVTSGRKRSSTLNKQRVLRYIRAVLGKQNIHAITKMEIRGREGDEESIEVVDLIKNRVKLDVSFNRTRSANRSYASALISSAISEYENIRSDLASFRIQRIAD